MTPEQTKKWWSDYVANDYFTGFSFHFSRPDLIKRISIGPKSFILEIGFGYGRELSQFCKISDYVFGVDLSDHAPTLAYQKLAAQGIKNRPELMTYDGRNLPLADGLFDLVYSCFVIQHMSKQSAVLLMKEVRRVLAPTGKALMEFFGCQEFYRSGLEKDAFSGIPNKPEPDVPYGGMYNNAYGFQEIYDIGVASGLNVEWIDVKVINKKTDIRNYWAYFGKGS